MAQGTIKSKKLTTATAKSSKHRPTVLGAKKGARTIAPRKQVLVKNAKMTKVRRIPPRLFRFRFFASRWVCSETGGGGSRCGVSDGFEGLDGVRVLILLGDRNILRDLQR